MTDEELAEQFADNINGLELTCSLIAAKDKSHAYRLGRYDGFLAGLNTGRPKWHDLRKDPNDLPPMIEDERKISQNVWLHVGNWGSETGYYNYNKNVWMIRCRKVDLPVLGWIEIPKFKEEVE